MVAAMAGLDDTASLAAAEAQVSRDAARRLDVVFRGGAGIFSILVLLIAWESFARSGKVTAFMLPPFSAVAERIYADAIGGELWRNLWVTMFRAITGFAIAAVGGIALGAVMARSRIVRWFFDPIISVGFPMPKIAFLPIIILWLGLYDVSKISIVVFDAIFPVVTATLAGLAGVEKELIWSGRNMGASERELMLGGAMMSASRFADSRGVFAGIVEIAIVGYALIKAMALIRRRLLVWHQETAERH
jgi:ABC-type nitrate/sulfonate/bicarbonate transport system permease component